MSQNKNTQIEWMKRLASNRPVIFSMVVILVAGLLTEIPFNSLFEPWVGNPGAEFLRVVIGHTLTGLLLVGLLVKLGLFKNAGFTPPGQWKALWLAWPLMLVTLLNFDSLIDGSLRIDTTRPALIMLYAFMTLTIGFCEEVMGRSVVLSVLLQKWGHSRRGIYLAVLVSGALFGAAHILNLLTNRLPLLANLTQIGYSFAFGVLFAACFLRNNTIWPMILLHAAIDFGGGLRHIAVGGADQFPVTNNTPMEALATLCVIALPLLLYALFILRKVVPAERSSAVEVAV